MLLAIIVAACGWDYASRLAGHRALQKGTSKHDVRRRARADELPWSSDDRGRTMVGTWSERAIDGDTVSRPRGEALLVKLREADELGRRQAERSAAEAAMRQSVAEIVRHCSVEYVGFFDEVREAEEYVEVSVGWQDVRPIVASVSRRFGPAALMLRVTQRIVHARAAGEAAASLSPPAHDQRWALWDAFRADVLDVLRERKASPREKHSIEWCASCNAACKHGDAACMHDAAMHR